MLFLIDYQKQPCNIQNLKTKNESPLDRHILFQTPHISQINHYLDKSLFNLVTRRTPYLFQHFFRQVSIPIFPFTTNYEIIILKYCKRKRSKQPIIDCIYQLPHITCPINKFYKRSNYCSRHMLFKYSFSKLNIDINSMGFDPLLMMPYQMKINLCMMLLVIEIKLVNNFFIAIFLRQMRHPNHWKQSIYTILCFLQESELCIQAISLNILSNIFSSSHYESISIIPDMSPPPSSSSILQQPHPQTRVIPLKPPDVVHLST